MEDMSVGVNLSHQDIMKQAYERNLQRYIQEHPGEWILYDGNVNNVKFFPDKSLVLNELRKYSGLIGPTYHYERIPKRKPKERASRITPLVTLAERLDVKRKLGEIETFEEKSRRANLKVRRRK